MAELLALMPMFALGRSLYVFVLFWAIALLRDASLYWFNFSLWKRDRQADIQMVSLYLLSHTHIHLLHVCVSLHVIAWSSLCGDRHGPRWLAQCDWEVYSSRRRRRQKGQKESWRERERRTAKNESDEWRKGGRERKRVMEAQGVTDRKFSNVFWWICTSYHFLSSAVHKGNRSSSYF